MNTYSVQISNNSSNDGYMCVYQTLPDVHDPNLFSLAWFTKYVSRNTSILFEWDISYIFVWAQTGIIKPGVRFFASQKLDANPEEQNKVSLVYDAVHRAYSFADLTKDRAHKGSLLIDEDETIPLDMAAVGIGMSGNGTFVYQAQPNQHLTFTPQPQYWIAFGNYTQGLVMDVSSVNNPGRLEFPNSVYSLSVELDMTNAWKIDPLPVANHRLLQAKR